MKLFYTSRGYGYVNYAVMAETAEAAAQAINAQQVKHVNDEGEIEPGELKAAEPGQSCIF